MATVAINNSSNTTQLPVRIWGGDRPLCPNVSKSYLANQAKEKGREDGENRYRGIQLGGAMFPILHALNHKISVRAECTSSNAGPLGRARSWGDRIWRIAGALTFSSPQIANSGSLERRDFGDSS